MIHRGSVPLALCLVLVVGRSARADDQADMKKLLAKAIEAAGGAKKKRTNTASGAPRPAPERRGIEARRQSKGPRIARAFFLWRSRFAHPQTRSPRANYHRASLGSSADTHRAARNCTARLPSRCCSVRET